jgi:hypothetical protein
VLTHNERDLIERVLDCVDPASDCAIGNDEIGRVREILDRETYADRDPSEPMAITLTSDVIINPNGHRVELMGALDMLIGSKRPAKSDAVRVSRGDYVRVSGDIECRVCGCDYYSHAVVQGFTFLRRGCDGRLLKL